MARRAGSKVFGWVAGAAAVAATLFAVAPFIVAGTSYRDAAIKYALGKYPGEIQTGSASFNWVAPVTLRNVKAFDAEGDLLFSADEIATERSLWSLAWNGSDVGAIRLTRPELFLNLRKDGSNLEDVAAAMSDGAQSSGTSLQVEIEEGKVYVVEAETGEEFQLDGVKLQASLPGHATDPVAAKFVATVIDGGGFIGNEAAGIIEGELLWNRDPRGETLGEGEAAIRSENAPLELAQPILRRLGVGILPAGELTADARYAWENGGDRQDLEIRDLKTGTATIATTGLVVSEPIDLSNLSGKGRLLLDGARLEFREVSVESELVRVEAVGTTRLTSLTSSDVLAALQEDDLRMSGEIDLAKVARALPKSLGLEVTGTVASGKATFSLDSRLVGAEKRWRLEAHADEWTAVDDGKVTTWNAPIAATATFGAESGQILVEALEVESDFLTVTGSGSLAGGKFEARGDLDKLRDRLAQFADLKEIRLAGRLEADGRWSLDSDGKFAANAEASLHHLELVAPGVRSWNEPELTLVAKASGVGDARGLSRLASGEMTIEAGADVLTLALAEPIESPFEASAYPVEGTLKGSLAAWQPRLQTLLPTAEYEFGGAATANFAGEFGSERLALSRFKANVADLSIRGGGLFVAEPQVQVEASGEYDLGEGALALKSTTLASSSLAFRGDNLVLRTSGKDAGMQGELAWRGDVSRISGWFEDPQRPPSGHAFGMASGNVDVDATADGTKFVWSGEAQQFVWATRRRSPLTGTLVPVSTSDAWEPVWSEPTAKLQGEALWRPGEDSLEVASCFVTTETLAFAMNGQIEELSSRAIVNLAGQTEINLLRLTERVRPLISEDFAMTGGSAKPFELKGPLRARSFSGSTVPGAGAGLVSTQLVGSSAIDWSELRSFGFRSGPGAANLSLRQGTLGVEGLDLAINEGRFRASPRVDLNAEPLAVSIDRGTILEQVRITPEMCRGWLKYAAPLLADATESQGKFSVAIEETSIPLADPTATETRGALQIHSAQIGPGPLGRQLVVIAKQIEALVKKQPFNPAAPINETWVTLPEQQVNLQMTGGRVYHDRMQFRAGEVELTTQGSVGLDQTLSLVVEAPIRDAWIDRDPTLSALRGQTLRIPVGGTVSTPQVDPSALRDSAAALLGGAARNLLQTEVDKRLNQGIDKLENAIPGLFRPRPSTP